MKNYFLEIVVIICTFSTIVCQEPWHIIGYENRGEFEKRIVFLEDNTHKKFVLKCYDDNQQEEAISESIGSFIGGSIGVPVHTTSIMMSGPLLAEISNGTSLATLHECVPGRQLGKWFEVVEHDIVLKGGVLSERHLNSLAINDDLCDIVALDIFLNNKDRHHENCFFDESTSRYYGIDMGDIFLEVQKIPNIEKDISPQQIKMFLILIFEKKIVALNTYCFLQTIDAKNLSSQQKKALQRLSDTLEHLVAAYSIDSLFNLWMSKSQEIDYVYTKYKQFYLRFVLAFNMYWVQRVINQIHIIF